MKQKLTKMNPFVKIEFDDETTIESELTNPDAVQLSAVVYGITSWTEASKLNSMTRKLKRKNGASPAFYCLNSSGLFGFCFADLGPILSFGEKSRDIDSKAI